MLGHIKANQVIHLSSQRRNGLAGATGTARMTLSGLRADSTQGRARRCARRDAVIDHDDQAAGNIGGRPVAQVASPTALDLDQFADPGPR